MIFVHLRFHASIPGMRVKRTFRFLCIHIYSVLYVEVYNYLLSSSLIAAHFLVKCFSVLVRSPVAIARLIDGSISG